MYKHQVNVNAFHFFLDTARCNVKMFYIIGGRNSWETSSTHSWEPREPLERHWRQSSQSGTSRFAWWDAPKSACGRVLGSTSLSSNTAQRTSVTQTLQHAPLQASIRLSISSAFHILSLNNTQNSRESRCKPQLPLVCGTSCT